MRPIPLSLLPILSLLLGACSLQWPWAESPAPETTSSVAANKLSMMSPRAPKVESNDAYRLDAGDRVRVVVAGQDALSRSYDIDSGGAIEVPSVGKVSARGLSTVQLSSAIARRLKKNGGAEIHVAVQVETYRPISIYGDVTNPGKYPYVNNMTTETAIEMAGGLKSGGDKSAVTVSGTAARKSQTATGSVLPGDTVTVTEER